MANEKDPPNEEALDMVAVAGPAEAQMIEEILRNNGIDCTLRGNVASIPFPAVGDLDEVRVLVNHADATRAEELVEAFFTPVAREELTEGDADLGVDNPDEPAGFKI